MFRTGRRAGHGQRRRHRDTLCAGGRRLGAVPRTGTLGGDELPGRRDGRARDQVAEDRQCGEPGSLASIGPASWDRAVLRKVATGADVIRINLSHGEPSAQLGLIDRVRRVSAEEGRGRCWSTCPGPKVRMAPTAVSSWRRATTSSCRCGAPASGPVVIGVDLDQPGLVAGDGVRRATAPSCSRSSTAVTAPATTATGDGRPGSWSPGRPVAGTSGHPPPRRGQRRVQADRRDAAGPAAGTAGADAVAASFVQRAADVQRLVDALGLTGQVVAKIETAAAVDDAEAILAVADAIMVARGDLGIRLPIEDVPHVQKRLVRATIAAGRPVITATQMLESMVTAACPTRAEVSDVANAVFDGTDAVMLSAETAVGADPAEAVAVMASVVARAEREADYPSGAPSWAGCGARCPCPPRPRSPTPPARAPGGSPATLGRPPSCCTPSATRRAVAPLPAHRARRGGQPLRSHRAACR